MVLSETNRLVWVPALRRRPLNWERTRRGWCVIGVELTWTLSPGSTTQIPVDFPHQGSHVHLQLSSWCYHTLRNTRTSLTVVFQGSPLLSLRRRKVPPPPPPVRCRPEGHHRGPGRNPRRPLQPSPVGLLLVTVLDDDGLL